MKSFSSRKSALELLRKSYNFNICFIRSQRRIEILQTRKRFVDRYTQILLHIFDQRNLKSPNSHRVINYTEWIEEVTIERITNEIERILHLNIFIFLRSLNIRKRYWNSTFQYKLIHFIQSTISFEDGIKLSFPYSAFLLLYSRPVPLISLPRTCSLFPSRRFYC